MRISMPRPGIKGMQDKYPDSKIHGANTGPTWVLSAPGGPHDGPMNLVIRVITSHWIMWNVSINSCQDIWHLPTQSHMITLNMNK